MIGFSQTLGYAVQILSCLSPSEARLGRSLSTGAAVPAPYMSKLVNRLARAGLVVTKRGRRGGIMLARHPAMISLLDVVQAVEGRHWIEPSLLSMDTCLVLKQVPLEDFWRSFVQQLEAKLKETTLADLTQRQQQVKRRATRAVTEALSTPTAPDQSATLPPTVAPSSNADLPEPEFCLFGLGGGQEPPSRG